MLTEQMDKNVLYKRLFERVTKQQDVDMNDIMMSCVKEAWDTFIPQQKDILIRNLINKETLSSIAVQHELKRDRVRTLRDRALRQIDKQFKNYLLHSKTCSLDEKLKEMKPFRTFGTKLEEVFYDEGYMDAVAEIKEFIKGKELCNGKI